MRTSKDELSDAFASLLGGIIGFAIFVWVSWCVVIGFIGGTYPLTDQYTEGSVGGGIVVLFVAPAIGAIVGTILIWAIGAVYALIAGASWAGGTVFGVKKPFMEWSDDDLRSCIECTLSRSASPSTDDTIAVVFHQDPSRLPKKVIKNTIQRFGEFTPYVTYELTVLEPEFGTFHIPGRDSRVGWSSHPTFDNALEAAQEMIGAGGREISGDDPGLYRFHETLFSVVRRPWEWD